MGSWGEEMLWSHGGYKCYSGGLVSEREVFLSYPCGCYAANGFAGGTTAAAGGGFDAVFLEVGEVGVGGARIFIHSGVAIVFGPLVFVEDDEPDGGAEGDSEFGAGLDLYAVFFVAWGC